MTSKEYMEDRVLVYSLLKLVFYVEPNQDFVNIIKKEISKEKSFLKTLSEDLDLKNELNELKKELKNYGDGLADDLNWEYMRLFVGPHKVLAPPWESFYGNKERLIFQESAAEVSAFYSKHGLKIEGKSNEPADHIGFMLNFMEILADKYLTAEKNDQEEILKDQIFFIKNHILTWIDDFGTRIVNHARLNFYDFFVRLLARFIKKDLEALENI